MPELKTRIKICGLTRAQDVQLAADLGAFALGFVFYPGSPRAVSLSQATALIAGLDSQAQKLWKVGVFVNAGFEELCATARATGLSHLQLHGDESPELCRQLQQAGFAVIKALRLRSHSDLASLADWPVPLLLDAAVPGIWGGSGVQADWELAAEASRRQDIILAGGLAQGNLLTALDTVRPWALDLSSGVESSPGIKDAHQVTELFSLLRESEKTK